MTCFKTLGRQAISPSMYSNIYDASTIKWISMCYTCALKGSLTWFTRSRIKTTRSCYLKHIRYRSIFTMTCTAWGFRFDTRSHSWWCWYSTFVIHRVLRYRSAQHGRLCLQNERTMNKSKINDNRPLNYYFSYLRFVWSDLLIISRIKWTTKTTIW